MNTEPSSNDTPATPDAIPYSEWLQELGEKRPRVARALIDAERHREAAANKWKPGGARISGLEELLRHLESFTDIAKEHSELHPVCRIITRMVQDFETAVETGLSGYTAAAADCMRDVMEATDLLLLFATDIQIVDEWQQTPQAEHWKSFSPRAVRKRLQQAGVKYNDPGAPASIDYKAHSQALHVNPWPNLLSNRGISRGGFFLSDDMFWWEVYEHARQLLCAVDSLRSLPGYNWGDLGLMADLEEVKKGYEAAKMMEALFVAMLKATADESPGADHADQSEQALP